MPALGLHWCVHCGAATLPYLALEEEGVAHGAPGHQRQQSHSVVTRCAAGHVQLERYSHDCYATIDADGQHVDWDLYWWFVVAATDAHLFDALACPTPLDETCACALHESLRKSATWLWAFRGAAGPWGEARAAVVGLVQENGTLAFKLPESGRQQFVPLGSPLGAPSGRSGSMPAPVRASAAVWRDSRTRVFGVLFGVGLLLLWWLLP